MIDFKNLISVNRIFEVTPTSDGHYVYLAIIFAVFLLISIVLGFASRRVQKDFKKVYTKSAFLFLVTGLLGLFSIAMRFEAIPYLGSRFFLYVLALIDIIWIMNIARYRFITIPQKLKKNQNKEKFNQYLPKNYVKKNELKFEKISKSKNWMQIK